MDCPKHGMRENTIFRKLYFVRNVNKWYELYKKYRFAIQIRRRRRRRRISKMLPFESYRRRYRRIAKRSRKSFLFGVRRMRLNGSGLFLRCTFPVRHGMSKVFLSWRTPYLLRKLHIYRNKFSLKSLVIAPLHLRISSPRVGFSLRAYWMYCKGVYSNSRKRASLRQVPNSAGSRVARFYKTLPSVYGRRFPSIINTSQATVSSLSHSVISNLKIKDKNDYRSKTFSLRRRLRVIFPKMWKSRFPFIRNWYQLSGLVRGRRRFYFRPTKDIVSFSISACVRQFARYRSSWSYFIKLYWNQLTDSTRMSMMCHFFRRLKISIRSLTTQLANVDSFIRSRLKRSSLVDRTFEYFNERRASKTPYLLKKQLVRVVTRNFEKKLLAFNKRLHARIKAYDGHKKGGLSKKKWIKELRTKIVNRRPKRFKLRIKNRKWYVPKVYRTIIRFRRNIRSRLLSYRRKVHYFGIQGAIFRRRKRFFRRKQYIRRRKNSHFCIPFIGNIRSRGVSRSRRVRIVGKNLHVNIERMKKRTNYQHFVSYNWWRTTSSLSRTPRYELQTSCRERQSYEVKQYLLKQFHSLYRLLSPVPYRMGYNFGRLIQRAYLPRTISIFHLLAPRIGHVPRRRGALFVHVPYFLQRHKSYSILRRWIKKGVQTNRHRRLLGRVLSTWDNPRTIVQSYYQYQKSSVRHYAFL